jgi:hypothetical protein
VLLLLLLPSILFLFLLFLLLLVLLLLSHTFVFQASASFPSDILQAAVFSEACNCSVVRYRRACRENRKGRAEEHTPQEAEDALRSLVLEY